MQVVVPLGRARRSFTWRSKPAAVVGALLRHVQGAVIGGVELGACLAERARALGRLLAGTSQESANASTVTRGRRRRTRVIPKRNSELIGHGAAPADDAVGSRLATDIAQELDTCTGMQSAVAIHSVHRRSQVPSRV